ncbi:phosphotriesterase family protein [Streptomyces dysideae]|uniref:phosphotriesterase family protein n=1 Tax=Streptomyces dysideae TaxID=909626 RepID=UPI00131C241C|nr:hypothetical protein [Streptomyces dysideae]
MEAGSVRAVRAFGQGIDRHEERWFAAGAAAARSTGAAVAVHTEIGTAAHAALDLLDKHGIPAGRVLLAHTDRNSDPELHLDLIARGAYLVYDRIGRIKYRPDSVVPDLIEHMAEAGKLGQIRLGTDAGRKSSLISYGGGPGIDVLGRDFVPRLRRRLGHEAVETVLRHAPRHCWPKHRLRRSRSKGTDERHAQLRSRKRPTRKRAPTDSRLRRPSHRRDDRI